MIAVFGSINLDLTATTKVLPRPGETVAGTGFATAPGGKGANQALAAARAGASVRMAGAVGADSPAEQALAELRSQNVDLGGVQTLGEVTGTALILVEQSGENQIVVVPGANGLLDATHARAAVAGLQQDDILLLQQEIPPAAIAAALSAARQNGVRSLLNTAPFLSDETGLAHAADIIVANETEFSQLVGHEIAAENAVELVSGWAKTHNRLLAVTLGAEGAVAATPEETATAKGLKIVPVDTVGAGDTFCGYFAAGLSTGLSLQDALVRAAVAGSLACLTAGAQPSIPTAQAVEDALSKGAM